MAEVRVYQNPKFENVRLRAENLELATENARLREQIAKLGGSVQEAQIIPISVRAAPAATAPIAQQRAKQFASPQMGARPVAQQNGIGAPRARHAPIQITMANGPQVGGQPQQTQMGAAQPGEIQSEHCRVVVGKLPPGAGRVPGMAQIVPMAQVPGAQVPGAQVAPTAPAQVAGPMVPRRVETKELGPETVHVLPPDVMRELAQTMAVEDENDEASKRYQQIELT